MEKTEYMKKKTLKKNSKGQKKKIPPQALSPSSAYQLILAEF